jgi:hypothetical protein
MRHRAQTQKSEKEVFILCCVVTVTFRVISLFVVTKCYSYSKIESVLINSSPACWTTNKSTHIVKPASKVTNTRDVIIIVIIIIIITLIIIIIIIIQFIASVSPTLLCTEKKEIGQENEEIFSKFDFVWERFRIFKGIKYAYYICLKIKCSWKYLAISRVKWFF